MDEPTPAIRDMIDRVLVVLGQEGDADAAGQVKDDVYAALRELQKQYNTAWTFDDPTTEKLQAPGSSLLNISPLASTSSIIVTAWGDELTKDSDFEIVQNGGCWQLKRLDGLG